MDPHVQNKPSGAVEEVLASGLLPEPQTGSRPQLTFIRGLSVSAFPGPPAPLPALALKGAERALLGGTPTLTRGREGSFLGLGIRSPFPALLIAGPLEPSAFRRLNLDRIRRRLCQEILPQEAADDPFLPLEASSPSLAPILAPLRRLAPTRLPILLLGETGTGKEILARAIHQASQRPGPFVPENCAALPENLLEAELFGVQRGAFTGAEHDRRGRLVESHRGTLLLDEIGDLPLPLQAKLLRVLQEGEVRALGSDRPLPIDLRVIAATHRSLDNRQEGPPFRRDLYFRLAGSTVHLPAVRHRRADLPFLCAAILARIEREGSGCGRTIDSAGWSALAGAPLEGNVRELENLLRCGAALAGGPVIPAELLAPAISEPQWPSGPNLEARAIHEALARSGGVKAEAARLLGWTRQKLYRRLEALGLGSGPRLEASTANSISRVSSPR